MEEYNFNKEKYEESVINKKKRYLDNKENNTPTLKDESRENNNIEVEKKIKQLPNSDLDFTTLPSNVVMEMIKFYKRAKQYERLYGLTRGKVQLAQERYFDLQRRYFAVCRELALMAGKKIDFSKEKTDFLINKKEPKLKKY